MVSAAHRYSPCATPARVLPFRVEEIFLCILIDTQGNNIQQARSGNLLDARQSGFNVWQAKMMAQDGKGGLPLDALNDVLRIIFCGGVPRLLTFQVSQDIFFEFSTVEYLLKKS